MIRNPAYDGSSEEDEEIDPVDIAPFTSCRITPIVTAPAEEEDGVDDGDEDEDEDDVLPGLETDESSSTEDVGPAVEEMRQFQIEWRSEDEEDQSNWDPPSNLLPKEYQFPNTTAEEILERMQYQVRELLGIVETKMNWPDSREPGDD